MTVDLDAAFRPLPRDELQDAWTWRAFIDQAHRPAEIALALALRKHFRKARKRYSKRALAVLSARERKKAWVTRADVLEVDASDILLTVNEGDRLRKVSRSRVAQAADNGFDFTANNIGIRLSKSKLVKTKAEITESLVGNVVGFTEKQIINIINKGLREGASVSEIAGRIDRWTGFGPARALRIARTEVTKATNAGAVQAMVDAKEEGRRVAGKRWLTQADGKVRASHRTMQGQSRALNRLFESGKGNKTQHPGGFGIGSEDANCRCFVLPLVLKRRR